MKTLRSTSGFTLLEVIIVISIISIIVITGIPIFYRTQLRNELDIATREVAQHLRFAQQRARSMKADSTHGVYVQNGSITLFQGASYASRNATYDVVVDLSSQITVSGTQEYVFSKYTGLPQSSGTVQLTLPDNENRTIQINAQGMVEY